MSKIADLWPKGRPPIVWKLIFLGAAAIVWYGCSGSGASAPSVKSGKKGFGGGGDVPVTVAAASLKDVPVEVQVIGNVEAYSTITVKALTGGQLTKVYFQEGDYVKKDAPLFEIDPRPLEAAVNQAQANLLRDQAMLGQSQANLERDSAQARYASSQAGRYAQLFEQGIISRDQAEQLRAGADADLQVVAADKAAIESARATLVAAQATVDSAKIQLEYTSIKSPINGRTGNLNVKLGNIVNANSMDLMTINEVQPIYVTFAVPEKQLSGVKRYMSEGTLVVRAKPQDDPGTDETGKLTFVENTVDMSTGTIKLKGTFPNTDRKLWPGEFVDVTLRLTTQIKAVVVPNQAIQTGQTGSFVYVVKQDRTVEPRPVTTGLRADQDMVIETGLNAGETVVTEGQLRLAPGSRVTVRDGRGGGSRGRPRT
jgi:multidrug efflux system membrane fusion protein